MHQLHHAGMPGRFAPLSLPDGEGAPAKVGAALQRYHKLVEQYRADRARQRALTDRTVEREADDEDAKARAHGKEPKFRAQLDNDRRQIDLDVRAGQVRLDEALEALLGALNDGGKQKWQETLTAQLSESEAQSADAWATYVTESRKQDDLRRLAGWVERFPQSIKWQGVINLVPPEQMTPPSDLALVEAGIMPASEMYAGRSLFKPPGGNPSLGNAAINADDAA